MGWWWGSTPRSGRFAARKDRVSVAEEAGWSQGRYRRFGEEENVLPLPGFEPYRSHCTDYADISLRYLTLRPLQCPPRCTTTNCNAVSRLYILFTYAHLNHLQFQPDTTHHSDMLQLAARRVFATYLY